MADNIWDDNEELDLKFDFEDTESDNRKAASIPKAVVGNVFKGLKSGAGKGIKASISNMLPEFDAIAEDFISDKDKTTEVLNEVQSTGNELFRSFKMTTEKLLPRAESFIPKRIYDKLSRFASSYEDDIVERDKLSEEQVRDVTIADRLSTIFAKKAAQDKDIAIITNLDTNISRQLDMAMHNSSINVFTKMSASLKNIDDFSHTQTLAYMRESLQAKWRHINIAKDTLAALKIFAGMSERNLIGIVKNTGLPEVQKKKLFESLKEVNVGKVASGISGKVGDYAGRVLTKFQKDLFEPSAEMTDSLLEAGSTMAEVMEMQDSMGGDTGGGILGKGAGLAAGGLGSFLGRSFLNKKLQEYFNTTSLNETIGNLKTKALLGIDDLSERGGIIGTLASTLPGVSEGSNILKAKEEVDDGGIRLATVEVIPGLISRILREVTAIRTGSMGELQVYDTKAAEFVDASVRKERMVEQIFGDKEIRTARAAAAVGTLKASLVQLKGEDADIESFDEIAVDLARVANNMAHNEKLLKPKKLLEYLEDPSSPNQYIDNITRGISNPIEAISTIVQSITDDTNNISDDAVGIFNNKLITMMNRTSHLDKINKMWDSESGELLREFRDKEGRISQSFVTESFSTIDKEDFAKQTANRMNVLTQELEAAAQNKDKVKQELRTVKTKGAELFLKEEDFEEFFIKNIKESEFKREATAIIDAVNEDPDIPDENKFKEIRMRIDALVQAKYPKHPGIKRAVGNAFAAIKQTPSYLTATAKRLTSPSYKKLIKSIGDEVLRNAVKDIINSTLLDKDIAVKDQISTIQARIKELLLQDIYKADRVALTKKFNVALKTIKLATYDDQGQLQEHARNIFDKSDPINEVLARVAAEREAILNQKLAAMSGDLEPTVEPKDEFDTIVSDVKDDADRMSLSDIIGDVRAKIDTLPLTETVDKVKEKVKSTTSNIKEKVNDKFDIDVDETMGDVTTQLNSFKDRLINTAIDIKEQSPTVNAHSIVDKLNNVRENIGTLPSRMSNINISKGTDPIYKDSTDTKVAGFVNIISDVVKNIDEDDLKRTVEKTQKSKDIDEKILEALSNMSTSQGDNSTLTESVLSIQKDITKLASNDFKTELKDIFQTDLKDVLKDVYHDQETPVMFGIDEIVRRLGILNDNLSTGSVQQPRDVYEEPIGDIGTTKKRNILERTTDIAGKGVKAYIDLYGKLLKTGGAAAGSLLSGGGNLLSGLRDSNILGTLGSGAMKGMGMYGDLVKGTIGATATGASKILGTVFGKKSKDEPFVNIYIKDNIDPGKPLLSKRLQKTGVFFEDGDKVEASDEIQEPVFDKDGECIITQEDIDTGLVDVNNEPLGSKKVFGGSGTGKLGKLFGKGLSGIKDIAGLLAGKALPAYYKGIFELGSSVIKGGTGMISNMFGGGKGANKDELESVVGTRLDAILDLMDERTEKIIDSLVKQEPSDKKVFGDTDGDGDVEGSYKDRMGKARQKASDKVKDAIAGKQKDSGKPSGKLGAIAKKAGVLGAIAGGVGYLGKKIGGALGLGETGSDIAGGVTGLTGAAALGTSVGRKTLMSTGAKVGRTALSYGARALAASGGAAGIGSTVMGGLATAGGAIASGVGAIAASPVLLGVLGVAAAGAVGYGLYKYLNKDKSIKEGNDLAKLMRDEGLLSDGWGWADWDLTEEGEEAVKMDFKKKELEILLKSDKISDEAKEYIQTHLDMWEALQAVREKADPNRKHESKAAEITKKSEELIKDRDEHGDITDKVKGAMKTAAAMAVGGPIAGAAYGLYKYLNKDDDIKEANDYARKMVDEGLLHDGWGWAGWNLTDAGKEALTVDYTVKELELLIKSDKIDDEAREFIQQQLDIRKAKEKRDKSKKKELTTPDLKKLDPSKNTKVPVKQDVVGAREDSSLPFNDIIQDSLYSKESINKNDVVIKESIIKEKPLIIQAGDNTELINAIREQTLVMAGKLGNIADNTKEAANKEIKVDVLIPDNNNSKNQIPPSVSISENKKDGSKPAPKQTLSSIKEKSVSRPFV